MYSRIPIYKSRRRIFSARSHAVDVSNICHGHGKRYLYTAESIRMLKNVVCVRRV